MTTPGHTRHYIYPCFLSNDPATTEIYTLSLHDALPISPGRSLAQDFRQRFGRDLDEETLNDSHQIIVVASSLDDSTERIVERRRSEEHTSELQSRGHLVCRLLLEKKKTIQGSEDRTTYE